jgi:DNA invertase Pin-like site-specific DNA recombinase
MVGMKWGYAAFRPTSRPQPCRCLKRLARGDTFIAEKLVRLGRSQAGRIRMLDDFKKHGVEFHSLAEPIDTETHKTHVATDSPTLLS